MEYYIYIYLDPRKPGVYIYDNYTFDFEPIYVGKGKNRRYKQHIRQCLLHPNKSIFYSKLNKILKEHNPIYFILEGNLSNENACKKEIELIKLIGRLNIKTGTLCNLTNGNFKKMMSIKNSGENNPSFIIYTIINENTNESIKLMGRDSVISYIMKYKEENKILPKKSPSYIKLLSCGESYPFTLTKFKPNKK